MSLLLITNPPTELTLSSQWETFVTRSSKNMLGYGGGIVEFTLLHWDGTTTKPQIAAGTIIEVGGSFYQADVDTALTDDAGLTDGTCHIKLVPSAEPTPLEVVPTLTNDALPAWDANKVGWYDSADKFLAYRMTKSAAVYSEKSQYVDQNALIRRTLSGGMIISGDVTIGGDLTVYGTPHIPAYGAVGSIVVAASTSWARNTAYAPGTTVPGSSLNRSANAIAVSMNGRVSSNLVESTDITSLGLSGTWRLLTHVKQYSSSYSSSYVTGLLQRIS